MRFTRRRWNLEEKNTWQHALHVACGLLRLTKKGYSHPRSRCIRLFSLFGLTRPAFQLWNVPVCLDFYFSWTIDSLAVWYASSGNSCFSQRSEKGGFSHSHCVLRAWSSGDILFGGIFPSGFLLRVEPWGGAAFFAWFRHVPDMTIRAKVRMEKVRRVQKEGKQVEGPNTLY